MSWRHGHLCKRSLISRWICISWPLPGQVLKKYCRSGVGRRDAYPSRDGPSLAETLASPDHLRQRCTHIPHLYLPHIPIHNFSRINSVLRPHPHNGDEGDGDAGDECISDRDDQETLVSLRETVHLSMDMHLPAHPRPKIFFQNLPGKRPGYQGGNGALLYFKYDRVPKLLEVGKSTRGVHRSSSKYVKICAK